MTKLSRSYTLQSQVQDARDSRTLTPLFSSFNLHSSDRIDATEKASATAEKFFSVRFLISSFAIVFLAVPLAFAEEMEAPLKVNPSVQKKLDQSQFAQPSVAGAAPVNNFKGMAMPSRFMGKPEQKSPDQKLHDVSEMYEKHFLREMMKAMRSTVHEGGFIQQNQAERIFREQLDDHYVDKWSEKGGIGLSKVIYEQLIDKFGVQMGIKKPVAKPQGPLPLDEKSNYTAHQFRHPGKSESLAYRIDKTRAAPVPNAQAVAVSGDKGEVKSPWGGVLLGVRNLPDSQTMVEIEHDNGLKSQVVFRGSLSKISTGDTVQAGETLGVLSAEARSLYWTVEPDKETGPRTVSE
ncbi:MAG: rod-binding protein [Bacillota bacterium]